MIPKNVDPRYEKAREVILDMLSARVGEWIPMREIHQRLKDEKEKLLYGVSKSEVAGNILNIVMVTLWKRGYPILVRPRIDLDGRSFPSDGDFKLLYVPEQ